MVVHFVLVFLTPFEISMVNYASTSCSSNTAHSVLLLIINMSQYRSAEFTEDQVKYLRLNAHFNTCI